MKKLIQFDITKLFILLIFLLNLISCDKEPEPEILPALSIEVKNPGVQAITVFVSISQYGSKPVKEHGFVWSENTSPVIDDNKFVYAATKLRRYFNTIVGLKTNTTYYFRAYIVAEDNTVVYSQEVSLKTDIHTLASFSPSSASAGMEVTITGDNFEPKITYVYVNDVKVNADITASAIKFIVPFGLQSDSASIAVEIGGTKLAFPKKLRYKRGRWTQVKSLSTDPEYNTDHQYAIESSGRGYVKGAYGNHERFLYEYDPQGDTWKIIAEFTERLGYVKWFSIRQQIFAISGSDVIMYDLLAKQFYDMPPLPIPRWYPINGISFSLKGDGYAGLGSKEKEIWKFSGFSWKKINSFPGNGSYYGMALANSNAAYVICGMDAVQNGNFYTEVWRYDPVNDGWEKKADYPGKGRIHLTGFVINDRLYVGSGSNTPDRLSSESQFASDFWEYDPTLDKWSQVADFKSKRNTMYSFSLDNKGFSGGGFESFESCPGCAGMTYDLWKFEIE